MFALFTRWLGDRLYRKGKVNTLARVIFFNEVIVVHDGVAAIDYFFGAKDKPPLILQVILPPVP